MRKYEIHNQVTGGQEEAPTFQEALALQARIKQDYLEFNKGLFTITVLDQNGDGSWTQRLADENGEPIIPPKPPKRPVPTDEGTPTEGTV